ncbi:MAG: cytochrome c biogenesis protein CcsA [Actinobacteria bacterium]|jgi:ABC-type transport system involved in cytochrome c biogenesis permease subunit|nr:cytochrome c biogenesis protein CcsA [Actinomycetota bacterium]MBU2111319.1 cytochrome c biogenesis protein CcsA [Actinomycetota bacterium]
MTQQLDLAGASDALVTSALAVLSLALVLYATAAALARTRAARGPRVLTPVGGVPSDADHTGRPSGTTSGRAAGTGRAALALVVLGTALVCLAVLARGLAAGRAPWGNMYEFGLTGSAAVAVVFLLYLRGRDVDGLAAWLVALVLVLLGVSVTSLYTPVDDLVPVLNSRWLVVHVAAAIISGALFTVGALATAAHLVRRRRGAGDDDPFTDLAHTVHLVAFPIWTFAVIAGAVWAENAWGRYWGWDPKETWAFITWVLYAAHLHALSTVGWRRGASLLAVAGFLAFLFNFFGVNLWISGLHSYAGV